MTNFNFFKLVRVARDILVVSALLTTIGLAGLSLLYISQKSNENKTQWCLPCNQKSLKPSKSLVV